MRNGSTAFRSASITRSWGTRRSPGSMRRSRKQRRRERRRNAVRLRAETPIWQPVVAAGTMPRVSTPSGTAAMRTLAGFILLLASAEALAQAPAAAPPDPFVGAAALGYLSTSGNTEATNLNSSLKIAWDLDGPWTHNWTALAIKASTDN